LVRGSTGRLAAMSHAERRLLGVFRTSGDARVPRKDGMIPAMLSLRHVLRLLLLGALCCVLVANAADRSEFQAALAAYRAGDFQTAGKIWTELAARGDAAANFNLGVMYDRGQGFDQDNAKAIELYRVAAENGYAPAQFNLGASYHRGQGVERDAAQAAKWWRRAAEQGFLQAQYNLGTLYYYGQGVPKDLKEAARWFRAAADQGDVGAREVLAALESRLAEQGENAAATGGKPATAARAGSAKAGGLRRESWLEARPADHYTIQIFANWTEQSILRFAEDHGLRGRAAYFGASFEDRPWFSLVYGDYASMADAEQAMAALPAELRITSPWIRSFGDIQQVIAGGVISARPARGVADMLALERDRRQEQPSSVVNLGGVTVLIPQINTAKQSAPPATAPPPKAARHAPPAQASREGTAAPVPIEAGTSWVTGQPSDNYTIQVFADGSRENAETFIRRHGLSARATYFESLREGSPWYPVVYGSYPEVSEARAALAALPASIRDQGAWVRSFGGIQQSMAAARGGEPTPAAASKPPETAQSAVAAHKAAPPAKPTPAPRRLGGEERTRHLAQGQAAFNRGNYKEAFALWEPLAKAGVTQAQYDLGFLYESGWGVARDYETAADWYRLAAGAGDVRAMFNLGVMVLEGLGMDADREVGLELVTQAAESGHRKAQEFLADVYRKGRYGLTRDEERARHWEAQAAAGFR
jgi:TPR repeat protein